jgi:hypothetical protein
MFRVCQRDFREPDLLDQVLGLQAQLSDLAIVPERIDFIDQLPGVGVGWGHDASQRKLL